MKLFSKSYIATGGKIILALIILNTSLITLAQKNIKLPLGAMEVGVSKIDITPYGPIRLSGYLRVGARINESQGVLGSIWAKAIAFGSDNPSIIITADLAGIQAHMVKEVAMNIAKKRKFNPDNLVINTSHTHSGPDMGNSHSMYFDPPLPVDQLGRIAEYLDSLTIKLEKVALQALDARKPSFVAWGQGSVGFGVNRRVIIDGKWVGFGQANDAPVDHTMPLMRITDTNGKLRSLLVGYACHGNVLSMDIDKVHGDWIGEAQRLMEENHPGIIALVLQGCAGDVDSKLRGTLADATSDGKSIADEAERLLKTHLIPLTVPPVVRTKKIQLPFDHVPNVKEFIAMTEKGGKHEAVNSFPSKEASARHNAEVYLERIVRGIPIDTALTYPIECFSFGNKLAMLFLGGEVMSEYSLRLRKELGTDRLWINAYTNDVKAYIPTKKMIPEGGYEVETNMYYYDHPLRFSDKIEDIIIEAVHSILPQIFKTKVK
ncbi:MAG: neutral/alkaline non-lysosomal ceramidase N-terminal domain-containing protein [Ginsengibacter sp.]